MTPPPGPPYSPRTVEVFTGAPGDLGGATVDNNGNLLLLDGSTIHPVATQTVTPAKLTPPEQYFGFSQDDPIWEYASAPFAISIPSGRIAPGNDVLITQADHDPYVTRVAQTCPDQKTWNGGVWNTIKQGDVTIAPAQQATKLKFTLGTTGVSDLQGTYYTDCTIAGAFTAKVHYTLTRGLPRTASTSACSSTTRTSRSPPGRSRPSGRASLRRAIRAPARSTSPTAPTPAARS